MSATFEEVERLLLPKIRQICHDPFSTNGNSQPQKEHVPSILLRDMREMTISPRHSTGMDFRSSDDRGRTTTRRVLYDNREDIIKYWDLSFRADPQRRGKAMQWTAHPVVGHVWFAEATAKTVESKAKTADVIDSVTKERLPRGNKFRGMIANHQTKVKALRSENDYARRAVLEAHTEFDADLGDVEPLEVGPPDPSDFAEDQELLRCQNEECRIRYFLREKKRGQKPKTCDECR